MGVQWSNGVFECARMSVYVFVRVCVGGGEGVHGVWERGRAVFRGIHTSSIELEYANEISAPRGLNNVVFSEPKHHYSYQLTVMLRYERNKHFVSIRQHRESVSNMKI